VRAQEPGTETPAPNTDLTPPLNPNSLMPLTLTGGLLNGQTAAAAMRQLLHLTAPSRSLLRPVPLRRRSKTSRLLPSVFRLALELRLIVLLPDLPVAQTALIR